MKPTELYRLENLLRDFIFDHFGVRTHNDIDHTTYKYKGLSMNMQPRPSAIPNFSVRIGMQEAFYEISSGKKVIGNLNPIDDMLITKWYRRGSYSTLLSSVWQNLAPTAVRKAFEEERES